MSYRLFLTTILVNFTCSAIAQQTISDARIEYKMELSPEQRQMDAMLENCTLIQYIRGPLSRIDMNFNIIHYTYLINSKEGTMITLIDQHGVKYLIRAGKAQFMNDMRQYENIKFEDQPETRNVAGYNCKRAIGTMPDGQTFEVFYTTALIPENKQYNRRFVNLKGIPLAFEIITKKGTKTKVVATKVDLNPIPASYFDVPTSGYKEISQEELNKM